MMSKVLEAVKNKSNYSSIYLFKMFLENALLESPTGTGKLYFNK